MSRPCTSVPIQCADDGAASRPNEVDAKRIVGGDERREHGRRDDQRDDDEADERPRVAPKAAPHRARHGRARHDGSRSSGGVSGGWRRHRR